MKSINLLTCLSEGSLKKLLEWLRQCTLYFFKPGAFPTSGTEHPTQNTFKIDWHVKWNTMRNKNVFKSGLTGDRPWLHGRTTFHLLLYILQGWLHSQILSFSHSADLDQGFQASSLWRPKNCSRFPRQHIFSPAQNEEQSHVSPLLTDFHHYLHSLQLVSMQGAMRHIDHFKLVSPYYRSRPSTMKEEFLKEIQVAIGRKEKATALNPRHFLQISSLVTNTQRFMEEVTKSRWFRASPCHYVR